MNHDQLISLLQASRAEILRGWLAVFNSVYPLETPGFARTITKPHLNPVGEVAAQSLEIMLAAVLGEDVDADEFKAGLDNLIKVRAVQDIAASQAVGPFYVLKTLLRKYWLAETGGQADGAFLAMESRIDSLALLAFDLYSQCRERIYNLRLEEQKRNLAQVLRKIALAPARQADGSDE